MAAESDIRDWIKRGWLRDDEAGLAFQGFADATERRRAQEPQATDYARILAAYEEYAIQSSKSKDPGRKTHRNHMSYARKVVAWLKETAPNLGDLTFDDVQEYQGRLEAQYARWTVFQYLTKLRLLLDQAVSLGMLAANPARELNLRQPKPVDSRRALNEDEIGTLLEMSLHHRQWINGGLPTITRLGLYAGLRNEEMCWLKWDCIDAANRIITIKEATLEETGQVWVPKDYEMRRIDVKPACTDYLAEERRRQESEGLLGPFIMPGGGSRRPGFRNKPLSTDAPQQAFAKMIAAEGMDRRVTVYSLRHTYATMALRAGVDLRTLQQRMGHSDIKTTMEYLHFIEPEQHPMDRLPY
ncbi:tyrosine-type recombinase/integrase [Candidatus Latescibacterota bacterium]